jgi:phage gp36-like protein
MPWGRLNRTSRPFIFGTSMTLYSTQTEIERLLSSYGVLAFSDHDESGTADVDVIADCIDQASDEMVMLLRDRYDEPALSACNLVRRWTTLLAAYFLCMRRGNPVPESIQKEYERVSELMKQVSFGHLNLPDVPQRFDLRPTWSNLRVDRRWPRSKTRVKRVNSSDAPTFLTQDDDNDSPVYDR